MLSWDTFFGLFFKGLKRIHSIHDCPCCMSLNVRSIFGPIVEVNQESPMSLDESKISSTFLVVSSTNRFKVGGPQPSDVMIRLSTSSSPKHRGHGAGDVEGRAVTHTTICLRPSRGLRMNLRVRRVTGLSLSAMVAVL